ncbi:protein Mis18-alpha-like [Phodopus roborovskii]|uniref:protein Mis18-alpha-like n=1 Tax=Phodopus roborovskii TaxID=109678 RepID=UPI0021E3C72A|nr:protein Mis18-alpha-like [Phodopus roborovskii]XP_051031009.1 protein Mis18-alpha-like [Phodopus roborovskii]
MQAREDAGAASSARPGRTTSMRISRHRPSGPTPPPDRSPASWSPRVRSRAFPVGPWGAADSNRQGEGSGSRNTRAATERLHKWASMSDAAEAEAERGGPKAAAEAGEYPLVFLCARCRRPLGDSLTWVTSQEDSSCILLRCVSSNVSVDREQKLSKCKDEDGCILETLSCTGCSLRLGYVYKCTPKSLDYKRDLFCLSVEAIESYTLGSSEKQIVPDDKELFNLENRIEIEKSIKQMEDVLKALEMKLWEVESKLPFAGHCS